jgi:hypothetical protein
LAIFGFCGVVVKPTQLGRRNFLPGIQPKHTQTTEIKIKHLPARRGHQNTHFNILIHVGSGKSSKEMSTNGKIKIKTTYAKLG